MSDEAANCFMALHKWGKWSKPHIMDKFSGGDHKLVQVRECVQCGRVKYKKTRGMQGHRNA